MDYERVYGLSDALLSLRPNSAWSLTGDDYSGLNWMDENTAAPTEEECLAEVARLQAEYDLLKYQRDRKKEYPALEEQLDIMYHQGYEGWHAIIEAIKLKYPKPVELVANIATLEPFNGDYDSYEINKQSITSIINEINFE